MYFRYISKEKSSQALNRTSTNDIRFVLLYSPVLRQPGESGGKGGEGAREGGKHCRTEDK